jgi:hypothetical protein
MRTLLLPVTVLVAALVLAPSSLAAQTAIGHPSGATQLVLRVTTGGGFVAVEANLRLLPSFSLYGDGTVIVPGAVRQTFPGPAVAPLVRSRLSETEVQTVLREARQAGLFAPGPIDYGDMGSIGISDAPSTTLIVNADGRHIERDAYALGIDPGTGRLPAPAARARKALARFIAALPRGHARAAFVPTALAVYIAPYMGKPQAGSARVVWPLARPLATAGRSVSMGLQYRCTTVAGKEAVTLLARFRRADEQSRWVARKGAKRAFQLFARPSLPDERGCA